MKKMKRLLMLLLAVVYSAAIAPRAAAGEVVYIPVTLKGENGVVEHNADRKLTVTVEGGELLAFGSANPRTEENFDEGTYTTYYGKALAAVRVEKDCTVTFTDGKETVKAEIRVK